MAIAVPWGPSMAINRPSMGIDEVFLSMIPSMGHRWTIDDPSMGIEIFDHKNSFDLTMFKISTNSGHLGFSVYLSFFWDFEDAQIFYSEKFDIFNHKMPQVPPCAWR